MRRKVLQHFANMFPQRFLALPSGFDVAVMAKERSGNVRFDFLQGTSAIDGVVSASMRTGADYREWLLRDAAAHHIALPALLHATMDVAFEVSEVKVRESFGHVFRSAHFRFDCVSELRTDEASYSCHLSGARAWSYCSYWEELFGSAG